MVDYLQRSEELNSLQEIVESLSRYKRGSTFAVDGPWGSGKSFLLDLFMEKIAPIQNEETGDDRYFIVRYNSWKYNYYSEPVVPMLSEVVEKFQEKLNVLEKKGTPSVVIGAVDALKKSLGEYGGKLIESRVGINPVHMYHDFKGAGEEKIERAYEFDTYRSIKKSLNLIREQLEKLAERQTIIFIVDELDRCLPEYTVKVLESLHHVFSGVENVITILAIDKLELEHVVRTAYGESIDVEGYLKKIIDFYLQLSLGKLADNSLEKYRSYTQLFGGGSEDMEWVQDAVNSVMEDIDIRTQEKIWAKAELIHNMVTDGKLDCSCLAAEILALTLEYRRRRGLTDGMGGKEGGKLTGRNQEKTAGSTSGDVPGNMTKNTAGNMTGNIAGNISGNAAGIPVQTHFILTMEENYFI